MRVFASSRWSHDKRKKDLRSLKMAPLGTEIYCAITLRTDKLDGFPDSPIWSAHDLHKSRIKTSHIGRCSIETLPVVFDVDDMNAHL